MDFFTCSERARELIRSSYRSVVLEFSQLSTLELLLSGALYPLDGFMGSVAVDSCRRHMRLPDGTFWPEPVVLETALPSADRLEPGEPVILRSPEGNAIAVLHLAERSPAGDPAFGSTKWRLAGAVEGLARPRHYDFTDLRQTPDQARAEVGRRGWRATLGCQTDRPLPSTHVAEIDRLATNIGAGILLQAAMNPSDQGSEQQYSLVATLRQALAADSSGKTLVSVLPWSGFQAPGVTVDPASAALGAIVARNYGCSHVVVTAEADEALRRRGIGPGELGVVPVPSSVLADAPPAVVGRGGVTVLFTGLPGSGKSTIANTLRAMLLEGGTRVTLLDGDLVRRHLSSELGYSREHRELNILRMGYVAAEITRHGGVVICAPIAPYAEIRGRVRDMVDAVGTFILVFVDTPLEACEARDPKGLYARAREGLIREFTGVSAPYEPPVDADIVIRTMQIDPRGAAATVVRHLHDRGLALSSRVER